MKRVNIMKRGGEPDSEPMEAVSHTEREVEPEVKMPHTEGEAEVESTPEAEESAVHNSIAAELLQAI